MNDNNKDQSKLECKRAHISWVAFIILKFRVLFGTHVDISFSIRDLKFCYLIRTTIIRSWRNDHWALNPTLFWVRKWTYLKKEVYNQNHSLNKMKVTFSSFCLFFFSSNWKYMNIFLNFSEVFAKGAFDFNKRHSLLIYSWLNVNNIII